MSHQLSIKTSPDKYDWFSVDETVAVYVKQLEAAILYDDKTGIMRLYPGRFETRPKPTDEVQGHGDLCFCLECMPQ